MQFRIASALVVALFAGLVLRPPVRLPSGAQTLFTCIVLSSAFAGNIYLYRTADRAAWRLCGRAAWIAFAACCAGSYVFWIIYECMYSPAASNNQSARSIVWSWIGWIGTPMLTIIVHCKEILAVTVASVVAALIMRRRDSAPELRPKSIIGAHEQR